MATWITHRGIGGLLDEADGQTQTVAVSIAAVETTIKADLPNIAAVVRISRTKPPPIPSGTLGAVFVHVVPYPSSIRGENSRELRGVVCGVFIIGNIFINISLAQEPELVYDVFATVLQFFSTPPRGVYPSAIHTWRNGTEELLVWKTGKKTRDVSFCGGAACIPRLVYHSRTSVHPGSDLRLRPVVVVI